MNIEQIIKDYNNEKLLADIEKLPQKLREFILNPRINRDIANIAEENKMSKNFWEIKTYTIMTLAGVLPLSKFTEVIETRLMIDTGLAKKIAEGIRNKVFSRVADELRKLHGLDK